MSKRVSLFNILATNNPKFNSELSKMFDGYIPGYIKEQAVKYANENNKLCCDEFINYIPSYMLANACENRHNIIDTDFNYNFIKK